MPISAVWWQSPVNLAGERKFEAIAFLTTWRVVLHRLYSAPFLYNPMTIATSAPTITGTAADPSLGPISGRVNWESNINLCSLLEHRIAKAAAHGSSVVFSSAIPTSRRTQHELNGRSQSMTTWQSPSRRKPHQDEAEFRMEQKAITTAHCVSEWCL